MYKISKSINVFGNPNTLCKAGYASNNTKYYKADICLHLEGFPNSRVFMNSQVLKEALLNSPELLTSMQLKVSPIIEDNKQKEENTYEIVDIEKTPIKLKKGKRVVEVI